MKNLKILIAEDDESMIFLLSETVEGFCKDLIIAKNGVEAVESCRNNPDIDLVLMDIRMPELDGYEATNQIRQFNKDVVIIAQTAFAFSTDKDKALGAGCNDHVSKPIDENVLLMLLEKYFDK